MPGSAAALGRDATVAWNYVDLRFESPRDLVIETALTDDALVVALLSRPGETAAAKTPGAPPRSGPNRPQLRDLRRDKLFSARTLSPAFLAAQSGAKVGDEETHIRARS